MGCRVRYRRIQVTVPTNPRTGVCDCCGATDKLTCLHHWIYAYKTSEVRKNPLLALDNTSELCVGCAKYIADPLRRIMFEADKIKLLKLIELAQKVTGVVFPDLQVKTIVRYIHSEQKPWR